MFDDDLQDYNCYVNNIIINLVTLQYDGVITFFINFIILNYILYFMFVSVYIKILITKPYDYKPSSKGSEQPIYTCTVLSNNPSKSTHFIG